MALWMEPGSEPTSESEKADLDAIAAIKQSAAVDFKEKGNEYVKMGKKHYSDAIDCYTKAINQNILNESETAILFSNRSLVNLLHGNYRRALMDAEEAIKLSPANIKALYRAAKASFLLNLLNEANSYCARGLEVDANNVELKNLGRQIDLKKQEQERQQAEVNKAVTEAKSLLSAFEDRGVKIGKPMFRELTGVKKPTLDGNNIIHWPVLILYAEVMSSDFIEDFCEIDMFATHLDMMFSEDCAPLPWDRENNYTRETIELYYEADSGIRQSKKRTLNYLLEGTVASHAGDTVLENEEEVETYGSSIESSAGKGFPKFVKINERRKLHDVLKESKLIIPEIPVFYVVSRRSSFYKDFKAGKWARP